jgi:hypothetical protein
MNRGLPRVPHHAFGAIADLRLEEPVLGPEVAVEAS